MSLAETYTTPGEDILPAKFLVIRFSSIGDIVLTTPVFRHIKTQIPNATVHFLTKDKFRNLLEANPYIDKTYVLEKGSMNTLLQELREENYDYVIDLHHNLRTSRVKSALKGLSFSFNKLNWQKWLMVNLKVNYLPKVHIVNRYLATLKAFGVENDGKGLDYFIPAQEEINMAEQAWGNKPYIAFVVGATYFTKRMTTAHMIEVCSKIKHPVVLLGGKDEIEIGNQIQAAAGNHVYNLCGKISLHQSASVVKHAKAVVSHDTGLMHIAAALKKPIASVWGNTIPEFGMTPYLPDASSQIFEVKNLKCRPCSKLGYQHCPRKHFSCMNNQDIHGIISFCNQ